MKKRCVNTFAEDFFAMIVSKESSGSFDASHLSFELAFKIQVFIFESSSFRAFFF